ncbi:MAG: hypothetical protein ABW128_16255 [Rhizorhabdus sp.]
MRKFLIVLAVFAWAVPAVAQVTYPPGVDTDARAAATSAIQAAQAAQDAAASKCTATPAIPTMETVGGDPGTNIGQCRPVNSVQPRITRSVAFTTGSAGTVVVTWPVMNAAPLVFPIPNVTNAAAQGSLCYPVTGTITTTGATIKCYTTQSVTVSLLGAVVAPLTTAGAGVTGQVLAIPAS